MKLRERGTRQYLDEGLDEDDIDGRQTFDLHSKLSLETYNGNFVKRMKPKDCTYEYVRENGFTVPMVVSEKAGFGIRVPSGNFSVTDVKKCVGSRRMIDVLDVVTQRANEMSMKEWVSYYENPKRDRLLNVISLEFSHTALERYVESPTLVRQLDWVDCAWPLHLKVCQNEATNILEEMMYPKVQKYCLMSVRGCYTDFHIDFGGSSVWYHILHGQKMFWLIPPTEKNLTLYEQWVLSGKQGEVFLADKVEECQLVELNEGDTFLMPSGWIHAVYTPKDSLVFGGNFIHSFNISMQLRIYSCEDKTRVPTKFRYPFFEEMQWYVLERYVHLLTGQTYLNTGDSADSVAADQVDLEKKHRSHVRPTKNLTAGADTNGSAKSSKAILGLSKFERQGLRDLVTWLQTNDHALQIAPCSLRNPAELLEVADKILAIDQSKEASAGQRIILKWSDEMINTMASALKLPNAPSSKKAALSAGAAASGSVRRRRVRCKKCEPCTRDDCQECQYCADMKKYGGPGKLKKTCMARQCLSPMLPNGSVCVVCNNETSGSSNGGSDDLRECLSCFEVVHPACLRRAHADLGDGADNEDLPNSWKCPRCIAGLNLQRHPHGQAGELGHNAVQSQSSMEDADEDTGDADDAAAKSMRTTNRALLTGAAEREKSKVKSTISSAKANKTAALLRVIGKHKLSAQIAAAPSTGTRKRKAAGDDDPKSAECSPSKVNAPLRLDQPRNAKQLDAKQLSSLALCHKRDIERRRQLEEASRRGGKKGRWQVKGKENAKAPANESSGSANDALLSAVAATKRRPLMAGREQKPPHPASAAALSSNRLRKSRCMKCEACQRGNCGECVFCQDMPKFGGPGRLKQACMRRKCQLQDPSNLDKKLEMSELANGDLSGNQTAQDELSMPSLKSEVDLPLNGNAKSVLSAAACDLQESADTDEKVEGDNEAVSHPSFTALVKQHRGRQSQPTKRHIISKKVSDNVGSTQSSGALRNTSVSVKKDKSKLPNGWHAAVPKTNDPLSLSAESHACIEGSSKELVASKAVTRHTLAKGPKPYGDSHCNSAKVETSHSINGQPDDGDHALEEGVWMCVFGYLTQRDLARCMTVCKTWHVWCGHRRFWKVVDLSRRHVSAGALAFTVGRQPLVLRLGFSDVAARPLQLALGRLTQLRELHLNNCCREAVVGALAAGSVPPLLDTLDLSWVPKLDDEALRELLTGGKRLQRVTTLSLRGTDVGDTSLRLLTRYTPRLTSLDISRCDRVTDLGITFLSCAGSSVQQTLTELNASSCRQLTAASLGTLRKCRLLKLIDLRGCSNVDSAAVAAFATSDVGRIWSHKDKRLQVV